MLVPNRARAFSQAAVTGAFPSSDIHQREYRRQSRRLQDRLARIDAQQTIELFGSRYLVERRDPDFRPDGEQPDKAGWIVKPAIAVTTAANIEFEARAAFALPQLPVGFGDPRPKSVEGG
jgi:hypothetical protein